MKANQTKSNQWVLVSCGLFLALTGPSLKPVLTANKADAEKYDGRDNKALKAAFFTAITGKAFTAEQIEGKEDA
jgi:hypothetical protein